MTVAGELDFLPGEPSSGQSLAPRYDQLMAAIGRPAPRIEHRLRGRSTPFFSVAVAPDGRTIAAGGYDGTLWAWDLPTRRLLGCCQAHDAPVRGVCFVPDGKELLSASYDNTLRRWLIEGLTHVHLCAP